MQKKRKINRWDRRRSKRRLRQLKETDKYKALEHKLDSVNIRLPELTDAQKQGVETDLIKRGRRRK